MEPSTKSPAMEAALTAVLGRHRRETIKNNVCASCGKPATEFRDEISRREFSISSLCQNCQNSVFDTEEEDQYIRGEN